MKVNPLVAGLLGVVCLVASASGQSTALKKTTKLRNPVLLKEKAPATFKANLVTSKGPVVIQVTRDWAPLGADRFYNLVKNGFFDDVRFFRVLPGFMVQFGMNGNPAISKVWRTATIKDDPVKQSNKPGYVTFAKTGAPDSRTTQLFINYGDNRNLDAQGFAPFGEVIQGMDVVRKINAEYREQPVQDQITAQGNAYLTKAFPRLDFIKSATIAP